MDIKSIIREMVNSGMSAQQIKANLKELGIENPDPVFADAVDQMTPTSPGTPAPKTIDRLQPEKEGEKELFGSEPFGGNEPTEPSKPGFSFTRVSEAGENEERVSDRKELAASATELMRSVSKTSLSDLDTVEQKLDQTIALLKALQDINQKILQSQRDVLLRLK